MAGSTIINPFAVPQSYADSSVAELKVLCKQHKLRTTGKKADLILRLDKYETQARVYDGLPLSALLKEAMSRGIE